MAYTDIDKPTDYFETVIWTGNGSARDITVSHGTNWIWGKRRNGTNAHWLMDTVRGVDKRLISSGNDAEDDPSTAILTAFNSNGFSLGTNSECNLNGATYVGWSWLAGGTASSNTDGSITSSVSASTTSGFSIVSYTGTGSSSTIGHGLSSTPQVYIIKNRTNARNWQSYHEPLGNQAYLRLNTTGAASTGAAIWNNTSPTSSVFSIGTSAFDAVNASGDDYIAYCFAEKKGYSKFGSYTGNGNADGTFVYTGLSPSFVLLKETSNANNWMIFDNKRSPFNLRDDFISPDISDAETTGNANNRMDMLSNGFKIRGTGSATNRSGSNFIFMAFAENPFVSSSGVPTTAR